MSSSCRGWMPGREWVDGEGEGMLAVSGIARQATWKRKVLRIKRLMISKIWPALCLEKAHTSSLWGKPEMESLRYCGSFRVSFFQAIITTWRLWNRLYPRDGLICNHATRCKDTYKDSRSICYRRPKRWSGLQTRQWKWSVSEPRPTQITAVCQGVGRNAWASCDK